MLFLRHFFDTKNVLIILLLIRIKSIFNINFLKVTLNQDQIEIINTFLIKNLTDFKFKLCRVFKRKIKF